MIVVTTIDAPTLKVEGWEPFEENIMSEDDIVQIKYLQPVPMFFICAYREYRQYGGPEEGGWGYSTSEYIDTIIWSADDRKWAEHSCRALNRLAHKNNVAPGPYNWDTSGIVFSVDRWPGASDTSNEPRPHYC